jgi:hypothetical protein
VSDADAIRPRDFALLLLASDAAPRQRARDQQADLAGADLRRRVLAEVVALDPEPCDLEAALVAVVESLGPPPGPTRALARTFLEEWRAAAAAPEWVAHLLGEAVRPPGAGGPRRGAQLPG